MEITQKFRNVIRAIVGLPEDPGQPPQIDRLAWYRAQVVACASDGSTCDVQAEDARIGGANGVKVLVGVPGLVGVVAQGAVVMLGWERGDPARPRCMPLWESGATVNKLIFNATEIDLAGNTYALVLSTLIADLKNWVSAANGVLGSNVASIGAPLAGYAAASTTLAAFATSLGVANAYQSTKVKNG